MSLYNTCSIIETQEKFIVINYLSIYDCVIDSIGKSLDQRQREQILTLLVKSRPSTWNFKELVDIYELEIEFLDALLTFDVMYTLTTLNSLIQRIPKSKSSKSGTKFKCFNNLSITSY